MIEEFETAREEAADLDVGDQPLLDRFFEDEPQFAPDRLGRAARLEIGRAVWHAEPAAQAVAAVEQRARRQGLGFRQTQAVERLELRGERHAAAQPRHVERLDAERIARRDHALRRRQDEGEHAVEPVDPARLGGAEQVEDGLAVALGREEALAQDAAQRGIVVDLAIGDQDVVAVPDRLRAGLGADDREPAVRHHRRHRGELRDLQFVRSAMGDLVDHAPGERRIAGLPQTYETAHADPPALCVPLSRTPFTRAGARRVRSRTRARSSATRELATMISHSRARAKGVRLGRVLALALALLLGLWLAQAALIAATAASGEPSLPMARAAGAVVITSPPA